MKLSQAEYNIKKSLALKEIKPSAKLWENIQSELETQEEPKKKLLWFKYASIAAVLCIGFFVFKSLQSTKPIMPNIVLESDPIIKNQIHFNTPDATPVAVVNQVNKEKTVITTQNSISIEMTQDKPVEDKINLIVKTETVNILDNEVDALINLANSNLETQHVEQELVTEVENLLNNAIKATQDIEQKTILKNMNASLLLAEVEADIQLEKPHNLKDKIWEALVSNFNDIKDSVVYN